MDMETGENLPIPQRLYNIPLKHTAWVQKELETLEEAGVIGFSFSPWASPTVVIPKQNQLGGPSRGLLSVDNIALNNFSLWIHTCTCLFSVANQ